MTFTSYVNELSSAAQQKITYFNASFPQAAIEAVNVSQDY